MSTIGVAIITHNARAHLDSCLTPVLDSSLDFRLVVVNSSSSDGTVEYARSRGLDVFLVPRDEFNHGFTRELIRKHLATDIVVMLTPDAYATDSGFLEHLVMPLLHGQAAVSYARQIPHIGADYLEGLARDFSYPANSELRGIEDLNRYGSYLFFCSNSCAAWSNKALDEIGGFPTVLTNEDTFAAAKLIARGYKIAYVAESVVRHSHRYSLWQEFSRYADTGYARALFGQEGFLNQRDENHGRKYLQFLFRRVKAERPELFPYAIAQIMAKFCGYKLGKMATKLPSSFIRCLSSQDYYWSSKHWSGKM
jgi:rhamnosyltransferase